MTSMPLVDNGEVRSNIVRNIWAVRIVSYFRRPCALILAFVLTFVWSLMAESVKRRATQFCFTRLYSGFCLLLLGCFLVFVLISCYAAPSPLSHF